VRQNRVTPSGDVVASPIRCEWMGNRGVLHRGAGDAARVVRRWATRRWIICALEYRGWRAAQWAENRYTVLFFDDEALALSAGHRPCALCRRASYDAFRAAWVSGRGDASAPWPAADDLDRVLHDERLDFRTKRTHERPWSALPDGTFVRAEGGPALVRGPLLVPWSTESGYARTALERPAAGNAVVLTPASTVDALRAGYPVQVGAGALAARL
jgi:hypothetical protein